jgi:hypothetical protein
MHIIEAQLSTATSYHSMQFKALNLYALHVVLLYVYVQAKLHITDDSKADEFITKHIGSKLLLIPLFSADILEVR